jgi:hypothetical protein
LPLIDLGRSSRNIAFIILCTAFASGLRAQICSKPPTPPTLNSPDEDAADKAFQDALGSSGGCMVAGDQGCAKSIADLQTLGIQALMSSGSAAQCAATGVNGGTPLSSAEKAWYLKRSGFWLGLYQSLQKQNDTVTKGTYKLSDEIRTSFVGVNLQPKPPAISSKLIDGTSSVTVQVDATDLDPSGASRVSLCVWKQKPANPTALDCTNPVSSTKAATLPKPSVQDANSNDYLPVNVDGSYTLTLTAPLQLSQYVSVVQRATVGGSERVVTSTSALPVTLAKQCNHNPQITPYSDCDMSTTLIGGVEQSDQSSLPSATTPFLRLFTRAGPDKHDQLQAWAFVRLLGSPQASSTSGVVSAVTDPAGNITTQTFSGIGTSVDFMVGGEYQLTKPGSAMYSISLIAGYGGTTPLPANTLNQAFKAPAFGTIECSTLQARFVQQFAADKVIAGTSANAATPSCIVNGNSVTSLPNAAVTTYTPITTVGFSNQDRTSFLGKALFGLRTMDRFTGPGNLYCGDVDTTQQIGPCERGVVDFLVGQDATVTGGLMRHFVFKIDAVHPLPVKSVSFLYLFGTATLRFQRNVNYAPLVLQSGDVASLSGNGSSAVPNVAVVILPLTQPNRDFYRFGVGVNVNSVFKKLFSSAAPATP